MKVNLDKVVSKCCPECGLEERPGRLSRDGKTAFYCCGFCGHMWTRSVLLKPEYRKEEER